MSITLLAIHRRKMVRGLILTAALLGASPGSLGPTPALASEASPTAVSEPRLVAHLLSYLAKDYGGAVAGGKVVNVDEYKEQKEFAETALKTARAIPALTTDTAEIVARLEKLNQLIAAKGAENEVADLARAIQRDVIRAGKVVMAPSNWPRQSEVASVFARDCSSCHGTGGAGDGPAGVGLEPKPANFLKAETMEPSSPTGSYNTIRLGVPGTGMVSFAHLPDEQVWALAFYVKSLRHRSVAGVETLSAAVPALLKKTGLNLAAVSDLSDESLRTRLKEFGFEGAQFLAALRIFEGAENSAPQAVASTGSPGSGADGGGAPVTQRGMALLKAAGEAYQKGDVGQAKTLALQAYLEGFEPVEPKLRAIDQAHMSAVEREMAAVRAAIDQGAPAGEVEKSIAVATASLTKSEQLLTGEGGMSPSLAFSAASAIILREGFEAVLIVIALLSVLRAAQAPTAALWVHGGWIAALGLGVVAWFASGWLMVISGAGRELLEGVTSLFAVVILLVVGFWLHNQTEIGRWKRFLNGKVREALEGGKMWTLGSISFIAVFREAFETVLFLRAIWLDGAAASRWALMSGVAVSLATVIFLSWMILRFSVKLPIRALFSVSSVVMALLAFILTGKGLHSLQETGILSETASARLPHFDLLGFYPTLETFGVQVAVMALVMGLWWIGRRPALGAAQSAA